VSHLAGYADPTKTAIGKDTSFAVQCIEKQNFAGTCVSNWHKSDTAGTRFVLTDGQPKENAANRAGFNGVKDVVECVYSYGDYIALFPILATHWGAF
jgi:hypothetical protein